MMTVEDVIDTMRAAENESAAILVLDSRKLCRLVAVWPTLRLEKPDRYALVVPPYWDGLWQLAGDPVPALAKVLRIGTGEARSLFDQAREARLIYPDGSVHTLASGAVSKLVRESVNR